MEGISSLSLQKEKFAVEKRKDNDDTLQTEREFVTKQAVDENGPPWALQGTSVAVKRGTFSSDL